MGTGKKEATRKERQGKVGDGMGNVKVKGENFYRYVLSHAVLHVDAWVADGRNHEEMRRS